MGHRRRATGIILIFVFYFSTEGKTQKIFFNGLGRALVTSEKLRGNVLAGDTATPNKGTEGYVLFDLGINMQPYEFLRAKAVIRLKNKFGAFYGQGASVEFRQVLLEGLIAKKLRYAIGDIDVKMTPYTVFNNESAYTTEFEGALFKIRRDIVYYENFNNGNDWRVQGAKANASFIARNLISRIKVNGFISRTRPSNYYNTPDRFLSGASIQALLSKHAEGAINYVRFFDLRNQTGNAHYSNDVVTGSFSTAAENDHVHFQVSGEGGYSFYTKYLNADSSLKTQDFFYSLKAAFKYKPWDLTVHAEYLETGAWFFSPSAQTLRIDATRVPGLFPYVNNNTSPRAQLMFDRTTQENLYNQTIFPGLMPFHPQYGNAMPYGVATPNRKGFIVGIVGGGAEKTAQLNTSFSCLSELTGEGIRDERKFLIYRAGAALRLNRWIGYEKMIELRGGGTYESTTRSGGTEVALNNYLGDAGLTIEIFKSIDLMGALKYNKSQGNEYLSVRNSFNQIQSYEELKFDFLQEVLAIGLRWRFSELSYFTLHGNYVMNRNLSDKRSDYNMQQYFINYTLRF